MWEGGTYGQPRAFVRVEKEKKKLNMYSPLYFRTPGLFGELSGRFDMWLSREDLARIFLESISLSDLLDGREGYGSSILVGCIKGFRGSGD